MHRTARPSHLLIAAGLALGAPLGAALASSHSDAPLIKQDPQANLTDVYAFIGSRYDDPSQTVLNVIVNVRPFSEPGDGPHYERFAGDVIYSIHITDPTTGATLTRYDFEFTAPDANYKNTGTILSYGLGTAAGPIMDISDAQQNFTQFYDIAKRENGTENRILRNAFVAPPNPGSRVTPFYNDANGRAVSGALSLDQLDRYTQQAIFEASSGEVFFAGPRDDSFFADIPGVFNLLDSRILDNNGTLADGLGQDGNGVDGFKGFNVLTFAVQIPVEQLPALAFNDPFFGPQTGVGVYAATWRPQTRTIRADGTQVSSGPIMQVSRLANPVFNEALVALRDKDRYNVTEPTGDAQFAQYALNPELAALINFVYGTNFVTTNRTDLAAVYIPDVIRVATDTGPVTLPGEPGFHRLGFIGGDTTGGTSSGWPNGRRLGDDVVDIALTAIASGPTYSTITLVGDNVMSNDIAYHNVFPYAATPHSGANNRKDPARTAFEIADVNGDGRRNIFDIIAFFNAFNG